MAKTKSKSDLLASLEQSAKNKRAMLARLGQVPTSVLRINRGALSRRMFNMQHETVRAKHNMEERKELLQQTVGRVAAASYNGTGKQRGEMLSAMAAELVEFFCRYYGKEGQTYLDPFMGHGIRMQVAKICGMHYVGRDASKKFVRFIDAVAKKIDDGKTTIDAKFGDSRCPVGIAKKSGDFCFTSPPYWDIEFYGDEREQLGNGKTYGEFLAGMQQVATSWLPLFKSGAWVVFNINDFRRDGRFYAYHNDLIDCFTAVGYVLHDIWIVEGLVGGMPKAFAVDFNLKLIAPKVHEYCVVLRVP